MFRTIFVVWAFIHYGINPWLIGAWILCAVLDGWLDNKVSPRRAAYD